MSDLFGSDLPVPDADPAENGQGGGGSGARFAWCDGVFLSALKAGKWVLLDELNLATQVSFYSVSARDLLVLQLIHSNRKVSFVVVL